MDVLYFDNAASSWPKPPAVLQAMAECLQEYAANPGRGSHQLAVKASRVLFDTRRHAAKLFGARNPNDISFTLNATHALNAAIKGFLQPGDHVVSTGIEHNSMRRPLEYMKRKFGVEVTYVPTDTKGYVDVDKLDKAICPKTRLVAATHSSNLLGTILPIQQIGDICKRKDVYFLVDAAQSAGVLPIDVDKMNIHLLAFPGHKGLLGPQGTGGLYIHPELTLEPLFHGGTGSQSESLDQPDIRPDRYEGGTQNTVGLAGLNQGIQFVLQETVEAIHKRQWELTQQLMTGLMQIKGIRLFGPEPGEDKTGIVAFNLEYADASEVAFILDQSFHIAVRAGFHCTPMAHESAGTFETGAIRASVGYFTTEQEVNTFIGAVQEISQQYG
ncbi:aminotransferase class V-fold PLP-dependent enzyme [Paenibacillus larvae]|uniref:cysteine desulfurase n=3 Tax=Paenibacillus larvae TaxID=1464 RepID=A0A1V0UTF1_9BACL|nr:aminotransferase class V-fold PLP-dependent enzyme [Paenibacillus larvae]AQR78709.1 cysteine desulfurase [Paenibacillus larvae subsp. larvae]ARF68376.1 cysteine desulfurase [Paenibacillus larvae subsp. pulvifaciens]AVF24261.1 cysteine desulfurase family protein [Paenibacillus larvae subsp. larvae]AVF28781.1 cysteine desulfurase family protein [Paenibacillus larvae subsp. larvae]AVF33287.1 cysteine desulfurase family protein [Paenibacillus larvae subsp. larvae]